MQVRTKGDLTAGLAVDKIHQLRATLATRVRDATQKVIVEHRELEKRIEARVLPDERERFKLLLKASEASAGEAARNMTRELAETAPPNGEAEKAEAP